MGKECTIKFASTVEIDSARNVISGHLVIFVIQAISSKMAIVSIAMREAFVRNVIRISIVSTVLLALDLKTENVSSVEREMAALSVLLISA